MDYLASYDLEDVENCVKAAGTIVAIHKKWNLPATFFVVGRCLEEQGARLRKILDDPLFDLQSHTFSHALLKVSAAHGPGISPEEAKHEIMKGVSLVRDVLSRPCEGLRSPNGFNNGFKGNFELLDICRQAGLNYVSSDGRGPGDSLPAPLKRPYTYAEYGYPELWELPIHGWHDNTLKGFAPDIALLTYPPGEPWYLPPSPPRSPEEHAEHHLLWVAKAREADLPFISIAFHPWSVVRFDPEARELDLIFQSLIDQNIGVVTATAAFNKLIEMA